MKKNKKKRKLVRADDQIVITWLFLYSLYGPGICWIREYSKSSYNLLHLEHVSSIVPQLTYSTLYVNIKRVERERIYIR